MTNAIDTPNTSTTQPEPTVGDTELDYREGEDDEEMGHDDDTFSEFIEDEDQYDDDAAVDDSDDEDYQWDEGDNERE